MEERWAAGTGRAHSFEIKMDFLGLLVFERRVVTTVLRNSCSVGEFSGTLTVTTSSASEDYPDSQKTTKNQGTFWRHLKFNLVWFRR